MCTRLLKACSHRQGKKLVQKACILLIFLLLVALSLHLLLVLAEMLLLDLLGHMPPLGLLLSLAAH